MPRVACFCILNVVWLLLPILGGAAGLLLAADALEIGLHIALLDPVPRVAGFGVAQAPLALDGVVDVFTRRPLVDEVTLAFGDRGGADHADFVLGPLEMNEVALDRA